MGHQSASGARVHYLSQYERGILPAVWLIFDGMYFALIVMLCLV